ncbi:MAG: translation initiation factor IF-1 [Oligoflexia bacterium]|nr:translation initiation factor IF-1 [Oligoflexia bacterium]
MAKDDLIELAGTVSTATGGGQFSVQLASGNTIMARLSGQMKRFKIRVVSGDKVTVAVSPYDLTHGFITRRHKE